MIRIEKSFVARCAACAVALIVSQFAFGQTAPALLGVPACAFSSDRASLERRRQALVAERDRLRAAIARHDGACGSVPENSSQAAACSSEMLQLASEKNKHIEAAKAFNQAVDAARVQCTETRNLPVTVAGLKGVVFWDGGERRALTQSDVLLPGSRIATQSGAVISLRFSTGERIDIGPNSEFEIEKDAPDLSLTRGLLHLLHKCLTGNGSCARSVDRVRNPIMVAAVRGTELLIDSSGDGTTISVFDGLVEVAGISSGSQTATTAPVLLHEGERVYVDGQGNVGVPSKIPAGSAPDWWK